MIFSELASHLEKLEKTTSRNEMTVLLAELFEKVPADEIGSVVYLLQGRVAPLYVNLEFGMADKYMIKAIAQAFKMEEKEVAELYKTIGDLGEVAEKLREKCGNNNSSVPITHVFETLTQVAKISGDGAVEKKVTLVADLLASVDAFSVRFISRIPVGKLRLGFSDMTVLDALSWMVSGDKSQRPIIEPVFNIRPDLGYIATTIKKQGVKGLSSADPVIFTPILMARAERLSSGEEIIEKIGECAVEPKLDGFRLQAHVRKVKSKKEKVKGDTLEVKTEVKLFTRNLEDATEMYPDVVEGLSEQIDADEAILEGEAIAYNPETGEFLPFQLTTQRKRKYGIEEKAKEIPLKLICFELLAVNGENLLNAPYTQRHEKLAKIIKKGDTVMLSEEKVFSDGKAIELFFEDAVSRGLEGVLAKRLDGTYQAGARGWNWIKFKRSYSASLNDTVDCVVMGYYVGQGKRTSFGIGAFLIGIYDEKEDEYRSIAKVGTGLTDEEWKELYTRAEKLKAKEKPPLYEVDKNLEPDVWIEADIVVEIRADEISRSPIHTAGRVMKPSKSGEAFEVDVPGYALRFPRLEKFRDDRKAQDITTLSEVQDMFEMQKK